MLPPIFAQVPLQSLWLSQEGGVFGMSLLLNVILLSIAAYLLNLVLKKESEKTALIQKIYAEVMENMLEVTKAITELTTIIKGQKDK